MKHPLQTTLVTSALMAIALSNAHTATIINDGFETPSFLVSGGTYAYNPATAPDQAWTFAGSSGIARSIPGFSPFDVVGPSTGQYAFLQIAGSAASISQTFAIDSAGLFQLSYQKAGRALYIGRYTGDATYSVTLAPSGGGASLLTATDFTLTDQPFTPTSYTFNVLTPGNYTLTFSAVANAPGHADDTAYFDGVGVAQAPEPSTGLLLACGLVSTLASRRRIRK